MGDLGRSYRVRRIGILFASVLLLSTAMVATAPPASAYNCVSANRIAYQYTFTGTGMTYVQIVTGPHKFVSASVQLDTSASLVPMKDNTWSMSLTVIPPSYVWEWEYQNNSTVTGSYDYFTVATCD